MASSGMTSGSGVAKRCLSVVDELAVARMIDRVDGGDVLADPRSCECRGSANPSVAEPGPATRTRPTPVSAAATSSR